MKPISFWIATLFICITNFSFPTEVNGRFTVTSITASKFSVLIQINTGTGIDDLGGATIVFSFDTAAVSMTENPVRNVDYLFHNFSGGNYSFATITRPMMDKIWINIDLPFNNNNNGTYARERRN